MAIRVYILYVHMKQKETNLSFFGTQKQTLYIRLLLYISKYTCNLRKR